MPDRNPHRTPEELSAELGDDFDVLRALGTGNVATVFLARERALSRLVAIKVMDPATASDDTTRKRFEREAQSAASLAGHPHVVSVYRYGVLPAGDPYIIMRYVKGRTMEERTESVEDTLRRVIREELPGLCKAAGG